MSRPSTEAEVISFDAAMSMEGIPAVVLWDLVSDVFSPVETRVQPV